MFSEIQTIPDAAAEIKGSPEFPKNPGNGIFFRSSQWNDRGSRYPQSA